MSKKNVFAESSAIIQRMPFETIRATTVLKIGGKKMNYVMFNMSGGNQNARLQVEASVDGSLYAIGCVGGIGRYQMSFYDGPFNKCKGSGGGIQIPGSIAKKYIGLKTVKDRRASVDIYNGGDTSARVASFVGLLNNMSTQLVDTGDTTNIVYLQVTLDMIGSWR